MTGHRGSRSEWPASPPPAARAASSPGRSLQGAVDWTKFAQPADIPEWISKAYTDTYQGPHDDEAEAGSGPTPGSIVAPAVTPALLSAHYRLGLHRPGGGGRGGAH